MSIQKAKFSIGDIVKHKHFDFRGVIYDVDFEFNNSEEWYQSIPKNVRPRKDQPFYHLLAENDDVTYEAYVSQQNLLVDDLDEYILPGIKENLVDHFYITPDYFENDLNTFAGSGFGIQPIFRQSAYFRYSNKSKEYDNFYFVGASTHPGAGVPGVISTAKATEKLILRDYGAS